MFFVKKWLGSLLAPLPLGLGVAAAGLFFLWFSRRQRSGRILVTLGVAGLLLCSIGPLVNLLHGNLETRYPPYNINDLPGDFRPAYIVVLGAGARPDARLPSTAQIGSNSLARLIEGIRIFRQNPGAKLLLSGGGVYHDVSEAEVMAWVATDLGVAEGDIILETESRDTRDEARLVREMIGGAPFILVTSASHMHRALAMFHKAGLKPLPAPAQYFSPGAVTPRSFIPSAGSLRRAGHIFYEVLGMLWARLRGLI